MKYISVEEINKKGELIDNIIFNKELDICEYCNGKGCVEESQNGEPDDYVEKQCICQLKQ